ncbi:MAG: methyltransferase domain-containing protein [Candidatus Eremiobacteraeota bacterium]|nr:methyltransferase domain-containing protein [Candidatus Eremiobacteraeota bacterium]
MINISNFGTKVHSNILDDLGPLYHSYKLFGAENAQIENFRVNQVCKESILLGYIMLAIGKCRRHFADRPSFAELFCADGYFTMAANYFGAEPAVGIDNNRDSWSNHAPEIARRLGLGGVRFELRDVNSISESNEYDIVANIGGLYHVSNPVEVLRKSYDLARKYLIIQTVVSLANNDENYFAAPAPGWQHGCRFNPQSFVNMVIAQGYRIIDAQFNQLEGNERLEDRGSVYMLVEKRQQ